MPTWSDFTKGKGGQLSLDARQQLIETTAQRLRDGQLPLSILRDRTLLREAALSELQSVISRSSYAVSPDVMVALVEQAVAQIGGFGFFHELLPPVRNDLEEIMLNPDGQVWLIPKGSEDPVTHNFTPSPEETWRSVEALLAPTGVSITKATPSVNARLPRAAGMGGARVKVIHPALAPGTGYPSINIRLFEPKPVTVEQLAQWDVAPQSVLESLIEAVSRGLRLMVIGGTKTGKTTLLSGLANGIPKGARVVKIEDPEEIWLDHPHVVTLEARPTQPGSEIPSYTIADGVDDALRMSPRWLIVGEVRTGDVGMALFRAQMSDHPGLTTFHAESPAHAVHRLALLMFADAGIRFPAAKGAFAMAVDLVVQLGWIEGLRKILGIWGVERELVGGDINFHTIWEADGYKSSSQNGRIAEIMDIFNRDTGSKGAPAE